MNKYYKINSMFFIGLEFLQSSVHRKCVASSVLNLYLNFVHFWTINITHTVIVKSNRV